MSGLTLRRASGFLLFVLKAFIFISRTNQGQRLSLRSSRQLRLPRVLLQFDLSADLRCVLSGTSAPVLLLLFGAETKQETADPTAARREPSDGGSFFDG